MDNDTKRIIIPVIHGFILGAFVLPLICTYFNWSIFGWQWWILAVAGNLPIPWIYGLNK